MHEPGNEETRQRPAAGRLAAGRVATGLATVGGLGDRLPAPGTFAGSLPAALGWWLLVMAVSSQTLQLIFLGVATVGITAAGIWAAGVEAARRGTEDPGPVVVDEVAGQWLTYLVAMAWLAPSPIWSAAAGAPSAWGQAIAAGLGLLLFRVFDILKPWPICRLERLPGGLGIMADDLAAGVAAGVVLIILSRYLS